MTMSRYLIFTMMLFDETVDLNQDGKIVIYVTYPHGYAILLANREKLPFQQATEVPDCFGFLFWKGRLLMTQGNTQLLGLKQP